jgi:hypothetical protein
LWASLPMMAKEASIASWVGQIVAGEFTAP